MRKSVTFLLLTTAFLAARADACLAQAIFTTAPPSLSRVVPYSSQPAPAAQPQPQMQQQAAPAAPAPAPRMERAAPAAQQPAPMQSAAPAPTPAPAQLAPPPPAAYTFTPSPSAPAAPAPAMAQPAPPPAAPVAATALATGSTLRHLTNNIQGFRLAGEIASSEWPVYITGEQARLPIKFQVGYLSAVSVMPEASYLTLSINDVVVGRANIRATHSVKTFTFDIPPNALQAGFNSIRLTAEQRHRVDCSIQATYELWTQIDPSQTGLLLPRSTPVSRLSDLPALSPDAQGALPIRAVVPGRTTLANVERIMRATQLISLHGRFEQPVVDIGPLADGEYGVNLVVGPAADVAGLVDLRAAGPITGPRVLVIPANPRLRTTIVVTGATDAQVSDALAEFDASQKPIGAAAGLRAASAFPGLHIAGGQRVKLRDLGVASEEFSGRLFRAAFNVILPPDFYPADYGKAIVDLAGGYAPGLTTEAHMVVSVNGRNAVSMKLPKSAGDVFTKNPIPLPLGAMRPGLNRVEIEAIVPMASDSACDPLAAISGAKRFLLLDSTEIEMPRIARIARMPDLAVTTTGGFPFVAEGMRPKIVAPAPDRETIGAAATIAAHMAIMAGRPIDFQLMGALPQKGSGSVLVVGAANVLDPSLLRAAGIDPQAVQKAWAGRFDPSSKPPKDEALSRYEALARNRLVLERNFPAACRMPKPPGGYERAINSAFRRVDDVSTATVQQSQSRGIFVGPSRKYGYDGTPVGSLQITGQASGALFDEWNAKVRNTNALTAYVQRAYTGTREWIAAKADGIVSWFGATLTSGPAEPEVNARSSLIVAQSMIGDTIDDVWTVVTAPTSADLAESVPCLVDPRVWRQIAGRMSILDASEGSVVTAPARAQRLIVTQPLTIENSRLIAAGWLSLNSQIYVAIALVIAMLLALTTTLFVRNVGRRQP